MYLNNFRGIIGRLLENGPILNGPILNGPNFKLCFFGFCNASLIKIMPHLGPGWYIILAFYGPKMLGNKILCSY